MIYPTAILLAIACIAFELTRGGHSSPRHAVACGAALFGTFVLARVGVRRLFREVTPPVKRAATIVVAVGLGIAATIAFAVLPSEIAVLAALLAVALFAFVCGDDANALRRAAIVSTIVVPFALPGIDAECRLPLVTAAAVAGAAWLMASTLPRGSRAVWAYGSAFASAIAITCVWVGANVAPDHDNPWYAAWVPASGGDGAGDDRARRGVGDGPDEIRGQSADSVGFDQGETFSESGRDGLYDLWIESYGAPTKPSEQQKMIGLNPRDVTVVQSNDRENLKTGRSFELRREAKQSTKRPTADSSATARLWIKGPMPTYVPLAVFEEFDGVAWREVPHGKSSVPARKLPDSNWMEILLRPISPSFDGTLEHQVRVGDLGGVVLPMPPIVERFKMGRVNRPEFFATMRNGYVRLASRTLPPGATFDVVTKRVTPLRLVGVEPALPKHSDPAVFSTAAVDDRVRALATAWGDGRPRGWRQIEQVVERLRSHVVLDAGCATATVDDILFGSRRGRDYTVSSAAAMLLRSLGYPTRMVSGFYADTNDIDMRSGFAALDADNVHFWLEVRLADGTWITVDPSPGYPMLNLPRSTGEWLASVLSDARHLVTSHAMTLIIAWVIGMTIFIFRHGLVDGLATAVCLARGCGPLQVLGVIELRARLAGMQRPKSTPVGQWLRSLGRDGAAAFAGELDATLYAEQQTAVTPSGRAALVALTRASFANTQAARRR